MNKLIKELEVFQCSIKEIKASHNLSKKYEKLKSSFDRLAKYLMYGGYFFCSSKYDLFITGIEFYYHEEKGDIKDPIVYHRNKSKWNKKENKLETKNVPFFPIGTINPHISGIDITFECPEEYRASALIRAFVVYDKVKHVFLNEDKRSTYVYDYFFDGLTVEKGSLKLMWKECIEDCYNQPADELLLRKPRRNVYQYTCSDIIVKDGPDAEYKITKPKLLCDRLWGYSRTQNDIFEKNRKSTDILSRF